MPFFTYQNVAVAIHSATLSELQALWDLHGGGYRRRRLVGRHVEVRREQRPHSETTKILRRAAVRVSSCQLISLLEDQQEA
jgi:hypothetical protein